MLQRRFFGKIKLRRSRSDGGASPKYFFDGIARCLGKARLRKFLQAMKAEVLMPAHQVRTAAAATVRKKKLHDAPDIFIELPHTM